MESKKLPVFRVSGLLASQPDDELALSLKKTIEDPLEKEEQPISIDGITIVPSCYNDDEKVALLEFPGGVPEYLSGLLKDTLGEWHMKMGNTDISIDQHFFGFTQLYTPKDESSVTADIIAITGLDGHAYGSWRGKGNLRRMWLRDFLSNDLPYCRTMIYGYNSKLSSHGIETIMDYGRGLVEELKKIRNTDERRERPLFFIAHSFGGIILAHCLVKAVQTYESDHLTIASLHRATYGILLFGIPHKGLVVDDIQKILTGKDNHPRSKLLDQIRENSNLLAYQLADFKNLIRDRKVVSFYETGQTRKLEFDSKSNRWKRTGDFFTAVETDSALLQLPDAIEEKIPLNMDHSMMVKFDSKNSPGYTSARDKLLQFERDAPIVVADRFSQVQKQPKPSSMIRIQWNRSFVGREDILAKLKKKFQQEAPRNHARVALVGLGGIGKTQTAVEYAHRVRKSTRDIWVFWIYANSADQFKKSYRDIAYKIELPNRNVSGIDIIREVYNWLCNERNGRWLMLIDNADDGQVLSSSSADSKSDVQGPDGDSELGALSEFLPQSRNGWILVTSRDLGAALDLVGHRSNVFEVDQMGEDDALELLKTRIPVDKSSEGKARQLVKTLDCIPLAITHAAGYMAVRDRIQISTYLELFRESEKNQMSLLGEKVRDMQREDGQSIAAITTWQMSFEQIQGSNPDAADLLSLMAMFDKQGIPESLVCRYQSRMQFEDTIALLMNFSLIRCQSKEKTEQQDQENLFDMHRLVQLATRNWLEVHGCLRWWESISLRVMADHVYSTPPETWKGRLALFPHARKALDYIVEESSATVDRLWVTYHVAEQLSRYQQFAESEEYLRIAEKTATREYGRDDETTVMFVIRLGNMFYMQTKLDEAETMFRRALETYNKTSGPKHRYTLECAMWLSLVFWDKGNRIKAEAMRRRIQEALEDHQLGPKDSTIYGNIFFGLSQLLERQGKIKEAELFHSQAWETLESDHGLDSPDTRVSLQRQVELLIKLGRFTEAENLARWALEVMKERNSKIGKDTVELIRKLASALQKQGKFFEEAKIRAFKADVAETVFGKEHPETLKSIFDFACKARDLGSIQEAIRLGKPSHHAMKRVLGSRHPDTRRSLKKLKEWHDELGVETEDFQLSDHDSDCVINEGLNKDVNIDAPEAVPGDVNGEVIEDSSWDIFGDLKWDIDNCDDDEYGVDTYGDFRSDVDQDVNGYVTEESSSNIIRDGEWDIEKSLDEEIDGNTYGDFLTNVDGDVKWEANRFKAFVSSLRHSLSLRKHVSRRKSRQP